MYYKSESLVTTFSFVIMTDPEESPTRYMLPDQARGDDVVDYSLNDHSPARYPTINNKRKKSNKKKKKKAKKLKPGKSVQFSQIEDIDLANEEDYPSRVTAFALKQKGQKEILKYQHQYRPLTPRRLSMQKHIEIPCREKMVTDLLLLLHRHSRRIRPRRVPRNPLQAETRTRRTLQESFTTRHPFSLPRSF